MLKRLSDRFTKPVPSTTSEGEQKEEEDVSLFGEASVSSRTNSGNQIVSSETVAAAATAAASGMYSFMKKAQSAASYAAKEGSAKVKKALDAADMDALQRKLNHALSDHNTTMDISTLNFTYVTEHIIAMGFPTKGNGHKHGPIKDNPIDIVAKHLNTEHKGHYMIWNLSEETYEYSYFDNQVLEFYFPGHPAPPLGLLFKICASIESWCAADPKNVACIHCLTGKGRTGTVIACYLAWIGLFDSPMEALQHVGDSCKTSVERLTIPSQRRYLQYFTNVLDHVKPRSVPLLLRRVIINQIPVFGSRTTVEEDGLTEIVEEGCCPYLQIFKGGKLVFTTTWTAVKQGTGVQWVSTSDGSLSFTVDCMLQGDILIRCRHLTDSGARISMFRAAFHTGYIPMGILRLTKGQLDGACQDSRFASDFFVDLIFAPVQDGADLVQSEGVAISQEDKEAYDEMLGKDEKFWDEIEARKARAVQAASSNPHKAVTTFSIVSEHEDIHVEYERKGSWDEGREKDLMDALKAVPEKEEIQSNTISTSVDLSTLSDEGKNELDHENLLEDLAELNEESTTAASGDAFDFADDDFDELEKYLSTLSTKE